MDVFVPLENETEQDPMGLLGMEDFLCPPFLICREQTSASMTFPEFQKADLNSNKRREGMQRQKREKPKRIHMNQF